jgi:Tol biopolymer transport system component
MSKTTPYALQLYRVPVLHRHSVELLPFFGRRLANPSIARQGRRLVYTRFELEIHIWRADGHTTELDPLSSSELEWNPQFSPDGKRIAFESDRSGPQEIWVASSDGMDPVQLTSLGRHCGTPRWSPDGRWIVFDAFMEDGSQDIWAIESSGGKPRRITNGPGNSVIPSFSHDGKWIYFANDRTGREVFRIPFGGGSATQITRHGGGTPFESADGKTIYYDNLANAYGNSGPLFQVPVTGGEESPVGAEVVQRAFQVVSDGIYFISPAGKTGRGREIRFYDFATRRARTIQPFGEVNTFLGFAVSPDRKIFLYTVLHSGGSDLMLVENFR